jgi:hypothetical protein
MPKVCFWATSFQADNQALAHHLAELPAFEVLVALDRPEDYQREPVNQLLPIKGRLLDRQARATRQELRRLDPDILVVDNHLPDSPIAPKCLVLWHGFGWRIDDLSSMRKQLGRLFGDVTRPNPAFRWSAFGDWDRRYRVRHSRLAAENVLAMGAPYSDLLLPESPIRRRFRPETVQQSYSVDIVHRKTVTLGLTWHHGGPLGHWGDDEALLTELVRWIGHLGANVLLRMHDRHRYERRDVRRVEALARRHQHVQVKFKSDHPDSLVDLLLTNVLVSNYSSLLNAFYYTRRPSVHIDPIDAAAGEYVHRSLRGGKLRTTVVRDDPTQQWKLSPNEIGGLRARSFPELLAAVEQALADEHCCDQQAADFCRHYVEKADGQTCRRFHELLQNWR